MKPSPWAVLVVSVVFCLICIYYYAVVMDGPITLASRKPSSPQPTASHPKTTAFLWCIFTKVRQNGALQFKFRTLVSSLLEHSSLRIYLNIISDRVSQDLAKGIIQEAIRKHQKSMYYEFYDVSHSATMMEDIVHAMTPHFSSQPGTYYSDALFYISLGLHRIAPMNQNLAILLDCDLKFHGDVAQLHDEFSSFEEGQLFGLAFEQTPVYRHVLYTYRSSRNTSFGDFVHEQDVFPVGKHPRGYPGYNSGVVLLRLDAIRESAMYGEVVSKASVDALAAKYAFKGHLGDQDFFTLLGFVHPELIRTLPCGFNRQLCTWWRDHGYGSTFSNYSACNSDVVVYHGNCNTPIP